MKQMTISFDNSSVENDHIRSVGFASIEALRRNCEAVIISPEDLCESLVGNRASYGTTISEICADYLRFELFTKAPPKELLIVNQELLNYACKSTERGSIGKILGGYEVANDSIVLYFSENNQRHHLCYREKSPELMKLVEDCGGKEPGSDSNVSLYSISIAEILERGKFTDQRVNDYLTLRDILREQLPETNLLVKYGDPDQLLSGLTVAIRKLYDNEKWQKGVSKELVSYILHHLYDHFNQGKNCQQVGTVRFRQESPYTGFGNYFIGVDYELFSSIKEDNRTSQELQRLNKYKSCIKVLEYYYSEASSRPMKYMLGDQDTPAVQKLLSGFVENGRISDENWEKFKKIRIFAAISEPIEFIQC